jgi:hypothetical protein
LPRPPGLFTEILPGGYHRHDMAARHEQVSRRSTSRVPRERDDAEQLLSQWPRHPDEFLVTETAHRALGFVSHEGLGRPRIARPRGYRLRLPPAGRRRQDSATWPF